MENKNIIPLGLNITFLVITCTSLHAKQINPAEILGRDLNIPGLDWIGHVGIATVPLLSPESMNHTATHVIEVLDEMPVVQINTIDNFKSRSKYWGSKYGKADRGTIGYNILTEASNQRWWCPKYTTSTNYRIGSGNSLTGEVAECGVWRCDTFAWWAFYSQGINTMPGRVWLPEALFNNFPYFNDESTSASNFDENQFVTIKSLDDFTTSELNKMSYKEYQMIIDSPPQNHVKSSAQIRFVNDENLNYTKRSIMLDRIVADDVEPQLIKQLLNLYKKSKDIKVKNKVVQVLMLYNQSHSNKKAYVTNEKPLLKDFFAHMLDAKSLTPSIIDDSIRGFLDTHSAIEIEANIDKIDNLLTNLDRYSSIMLKYTMLYKSNLLQLKYTQSIVDQLRKADSAELDSYFFGPLSIGYKGTGEKLLTRASRQVAINYLQEVAHKYTPEGIIESPDDKQRAITAPIYFELISNMGLKSKG